MSFAAFLGRNVPALILLALGYALIIVEIYVPGFGLPGVCGILLGVTAMVLMRPTAGQALILALVSAAVLGVAFFTALRSFSKGRLSRSRLVLRDDVRKPDSEKNASEPEVAVGAVGTAHSSLRPAGIALFGDRRLNVVTDGDFIEAGEAVVVTGVSGGRIVVQSRADASAV